MSNSETSPDDQMPVPPPAWFNRMEARYRWFGWITGLFFIVLSGTAPNVWLALAVGLAGVCLTAHWVIERFEATLGRKLMWARYTEAVVLSIAAPLLAAVGFIVWGLNGFVIAF